MTDNELIANNSIIDGFMGYKYYVGYGYNGDLYYDEAVIDPDESDFVQAPPHWHESWDWLMPVVEKIESLGHSVVISSTYNQYCNIMYGNTLDRLRQGEETKAMGVAETKIEAVYKAVVEFIKWYNENKKV